MKKKIALMIIEDETAIRDMVRFSLPTNEFNTVDAEDTAKAMKLLADKIPDLILLDWMLPGMSGIEFIKWIKQQEDLSNIPIIMLTAKAEEENKVKGLMIGADDYITKPFSPNELIARVKAVLRRGLILTPNNEIKYRDLILNISKYQLTINNNPIKLSPIEFKMLHFFMKHPNKIYSRSQLITHIWGGNVYIDDRTVDVQIRRLRDKLKEFNYHDLLQTVRSVGYTWVQDEK